VKRLSLSTACSTLKQSALANTGLPALYHKTQPVRIEDEFGEAVKLAGLIQGDMLKNLIADESNLSIWSF